MRLRSFFLIMLTLLVLLSVAAPPRSAETAAFPEKGKTITFIVNQPAGGPSDLASRVLAAAMEKELGVPIAIVNKPGATTQLGNTELANAKPDGYTLEEVSLPAAVITYLDAERKATYTRKSFQPVSMYNVEPIGIAVIPRSGRSPANR